ncbi:ATP-binding protein [Morganella morganii]
MNDIDRINSLKAINIAAFSIHEPSDPLITFEPSWYNVWESHMLRCSYKKTGSSSWSFKRYGFNNEMYREGIRKASYRPFINAMENTFSHAYNSLNIKNRRSLKNERNGLIYIDSWGDLSSFEKIDNWKDTYSINIIPKKIIKDYSIKHFTSKLRGERNGFLNAFLMAQGLLNSDMLDNVFIYAGYRAVPVMMFTEIDKQPKTHFLTKKIRNKTISIERTSCFILNKKMESEYSCEIDKYFSLSHNIKRSIDILIDNFNSTVGDNISSLYTSALPTHTHSYILNKFVTKSGMSSNHISLNETYGDSGFLTPAMMWADLKKSNNKNNKDVMINLDGENGAWFVHSWRS